MLGTWPEVYSFCSTCNVQMHKHFHVLKIAGKNSKSKFRKKNKNKLLIFSNAVQQSTNIFLINVNFKNSLYTFIYIQNIITDDFKLAQQLNNKFC